MIGVAIGCLIYGTLNTAGAISWFDQHTGLAAWVQAIGSIVVIWAGIYGVRHQIQANAKAQRDGETKLLEGRLRAYASAIGMAERATSSTLRTLEKSPDKQSTARRQLRVGINDELNMLFREIRVTDLAVPALIDVIFTARSTNVSVRNGMEILADAETTPEMVDVWLNFIKRQPNRFASLRVTLTHWADGVAQNGFADWTTKAGGIASSSTEQEPAEPIGTEEARMP